MKRMIVLLALFSAPLMNVKAEVCAANSIDIFPTTPTSPRFEFETNSEVVLDKKTGLKWARCQWGHNWNAGSATCEAETSNTISWKDALILVNEDPVLYGEQGWRVPNLKELASIIESKCANPAINDEVFPGTKSGDYWSTTYVLGDGSLRTVNFGSGALSSRPNMNSEEHYLRLVKDAETQVQ